MARPFRQQVDEGIVDRAAALFARRGVDQTSVQAVADAVGLSKAGLLHHFPSKDALREAVLAQAAALGQQALDEVAGLAPGPARDRRALEVLVDIAFTHPGLVALLLSPATQLPAEQDVALAAPGRLALAAFGVDPDDPDGADTDRFIRVVGALACLAVLALSAHQAGQTSRWRSTVLATSYDALGHGSDPAGTPHHPHPAED